MWRSFDVATVVAPLFAGGGHLAAGAAGMARRVARARFAEGADELRRAGAHELLVVGAATLDAHGAPWDGLVDRLVVDQVAALAIHPAADDELAIQLLGAADRASLPVIVLSREVSWSEVKAAVTDALLEAQGNRLEQVFNIHERFMDVVAAGGGTAEIARTLQSLLTVPVAVVDADGRPMVVVPAAAERGLDQAIATGERRAIRVGEQSYGTIIAFTDGAAIDEDGRLAMEHASMAIAVRRAQANAVAEAHERFAASSLEELIAGHLASAADVAERATSFGWDLSRPRAVLLASVDPPTDERLANALGTVAAAARATLGRDAIVWTRSATIAALIAPHTDEPAERRRMAERLREELDRRLRTVTVSIGVGRRVDTPMSLQQSYAEARRAVDVGRWAKGRHVTEVFDELGLERLLAATPTDDLAEFVDHVIGPLVAHDRASGTELVETLGIWLQTRNMAEAARRLHVHYNTLKNRLERIESIIGPVLTDAGRALECEIAIYVAHHYDGPWAGSGGV